MSAKTIYLILVLLGLHVLGEYYYVTTFTFSVFTTCNCQYGWVSAAFTLSLLPPSPVSHCLSVNPQYIPEPEGDEEVHFFCIESPNSYATDITWRDPQGNLYTPGSPSVGGNSRITAEGSRLSILNLVRNDTGHYRCYRNSDPTDYAEGQLLVYGKYM